MSLPSIATFVDEQEKILAWGFCNIGWFLTESLLPRCVEEALTNAIEATDGNRWAYRVEDDETAPVWDQDWRSKWVYVKLYGYTLDRQVLADDYNRRMEKAKASEQQGCGEAG